MSWTERCCVCGLFGAFALLVEADGWDRWGREQESRVLDGQAVLLIEWREDGEFHRRQGRSLPEPTVQYVRTLIGGKDDNPYSLFW